MIDHQLYFKNRLHYTKEKLIIETLEELSDCYDKVIVPENFFSDGSSLPKVIWRFFPVFGKYLKAAIIHDFIYAVRLEPFTRLQADKLFYLQMLHDKTSKPLAYLFFILVRLFGKSRWEMRTSEKMVNAQLLTPTQK